MPLEYLPESRIGVPEVRLGEVNAVTTSQESFAEEAVQARIVTDKRITKLRDVETGQELTGQAQGNTTVFETPLTRGTYRVFSAQ